MSKVGLPIPGDKLLRELIVKTAMQCPHCEKFVILNLFGTASERNEASRVLVPFQREGRLSLVSTEDAEEEQRSHRGDPNWGINPELTKKDPYDD